MTWNFFVPYKPTNFCKKYVLLKPLYNDERNSTLQYAILAVILFAWYAAAYTKGAARGPFPTRFTQIPFSSTLYFFRPPPS